MPNNEKPEADQPTRGELKPPFEVEYPNDGITWNSESAERRYETGQAAISDVSSVKIFDVEVVPIPEVESRQQPTKGTNMTQKKSRTPPRSRRRVGPDDNWTGKDGELIDPNLH
jgi:hypothetical protein